MCFGLGRSLEMIVSPLFILSPAMELTGHPIQVLNQKDAFDPQVVVDDARGIVHLIIRSNDDGLLHFQVVNGTLGLPQIIDKEAAVRPKVSLNSKTGELFGVWARVVMVEVPASTTMKWILYVSHWDGKQWQAPVMVTDLVQSWDIAVNPDGAVLLGVINENQSSAQTYFAANGLAFGAPIAIQASYSWPEKDDSISVMYSSADQCFHSITGHLIWAGNSDIFHYFWNGAAWEFQQNVSEGQEANFSARGFIGDLPDQQALLISWMEFLPQQETLMYRVIKGSIITAKQDIGHYITDAKVALMTAGLHAFQTDANGNLHLVVGEYQYMDGGVYYLALPKPSAPADVSPWMIY